MGVGAVGEDGAVDGEGDEGMGGRGEVEGDFGAGALDSGDLAGGFIAVDQEVGGGEVRVFEVGAVEEKDAAVVEGEVAGGAGGAAQDEGGGDVDGLFAEGAFSVLGAKEIGLGDAEGDEDEEEENTVEEAFELGVDDFIAKPFNPNELLLRIKRFL